MVAVVTELEYVDVDAHDALLAFGGGGAKGVLDVFQLVVEGRVVHVGVAFGHAVEVKAVGPLPADRLRP